MLKSFIDRGFDRWINREGDSQTDYLYEFTNLRKHWRWSEDTSSVYTCCICCICIDGTIFRFHLYNYYGIAIHNSAGDFLQVPGGYTSCILPRDRERFIGYRENAFCCLQQDSEGFHIQGVHSDFNRRTQQLSLVTFYMLGCC